MTEAGVLIVDDEPIFMGGIHYGHLLRQLQTRKAQSVKLVSPQLALAMDAIPPGPLTESYEISLTPTPEDNPTAFLQEGNRKVRRRGYRSPSPDIGRMPPEENNNFQANRRMEKARDKTRRRATLKMKKTARRRARA